MKDFYTLAKELRQALRELYPRGYAGRKQIGNTEIITIRNFSDKPIEVIKLELIDTDGIAYDITNDVRLISFTKNTIATSDTPVTFYRTK